MILKEHKKHTELIKPKQGNFGRNEWAIVGAPCADIRALAEAIISNLGSQFQCAYTDAAHPKDESGVALPGVLAAGAVAEYADRINHHVFSFSKSFNAFQFRQIFAEADLVLVNGNHQQANAQVVIIHPKKEASLKRKISQLTKVDLFLLADGEDDLFEFIKTSITGWEQVPVYRLSDTEKIVSFFKNKMETAIPPINGLVLAGGKSLRLGNDKGKINWHGKEQRYYVADLLQIICDRVFISCRQDQQDEMDHQYRTLPDTFNGLGPYGAILSAFREQPDSAWLVVACDLPFLDESILRFLVAHRNPYAVATTFQSSFDSLPEPLITIWEPKSYPALLSFLSQGYSCPRKVLINSNASILQVPKPEALMNVNTPEEYDQAKELLSQKA